MILILFLGTFCGVFIRSSSALQYYVNADHGFDQLNNCLSSTMPCLTIAHAIHEMQNATINPDQTAVINLQQSSSNYSCWGSLGKVIEVDNFTFEISGGSHYAIIDCTGYKGEQLFVKNGSVSFSTLDVYLPSDPDTIWLNTVDSSVLVTFFVTFQGTMELNSANFNTVRLLSQFSNMTPGVSYTYTMSATVRNIGAGIIVIKNTSRPLKISLTGSADNSGFLYNSQTADDGSTISVSNYGVSGQLMDGFGFANFIFNFLEVSNLKMSFHQFDPSFGSNGVRITASAALNSSISFSNSNFVGISTSPISIAISEAKNTSVQLTECYFVGNAGAIEISGPISWTDSQFLISHSTFSENVNIPIIYDALAGNNTKFLIENSTFISNIVRMNPEQLAKQRRTWSGALSIRFSSFSDQELPCSTETTWRQWNYTNFLIISNSQFESNTCYNCSGGALHVQNGFVQLINSNIYNNSADIYGSNVYISGTASLSLDNTAILPVFNTYPFAQGRGIYSSSEGSISLKNGSRVQAFDSTQSLADLVGVQAGGGEFSVDNSSLFACPAGQAYSTEYSRPEYAAPLPGSICYSKFSIIQNFCQSCPTNTYSLIGGTNKDPNNEFVCNPCPKGGNCDRGGPWVRSTAQYWGSIIQTKRFANEGPQVRFYNCPLGYCCVPPRGESSCESYDTCNGNREGILCGDCQVGFSHTLGSAECVPTYECGKSLMDRLFWVFFFLVGVVYVCYFLLNPPVFSFAWSVLTWLHLRDKQDQKSKSFQLRNSKKLDSKKLEESVQENENEKSDKNDDDEFVIEDSDAPLIHPTDRTSINLLSEKDDYKKETPATSDFSPSFTKTIFYFYQVLPLLMMQRQSSTSVIQNSVLSLLNFQIHGGKLCPIGLSNLTPVMERLSFLLLPVLILFLILVTFFVKYALQKCLKISENYSPYYGAVLQTILFSYSNITSTFFVLGYCIEINGISRLWIQGTIPCMTGWSFTFIVVSTIIVIPFPFVLVMSSRLLQQKKISLMRFLIYCCLPPVSIICGSYQPYKDLVSSFIQWIQQVFDTLRGVPVLPTFQSIISETQEKEVAFEDPQPKQTPESCMLKIVLGSYREKHWYWEAIMLGRRLLFNAIKTYSSSPLVGTFFACVFSWLVSLHHIYNKPFSAPLANLFESCSLLTLAIISTGQLMNGVMIQGGVSIHSTFVDGFFWFQEITIIFLPACVLLYFLISGLSGLVSLAPWLWRCFASKKKVI